MTEWPEIQPTLDELLEALVKEWGVGVIRLNEFEHLFGKSEHVELLNSLGGTFFGVVQQVLFDDLQLCISRLTDPRRKVGNLTVKLLPDFCECDKLREVVKEQVGQACEAANKSARQHRNKRISHNDLAYAIGASEELPATTLRQIRVALDAVYAVLQTVYKELRGGKTLDAPVLDSPGVDVLLGRTEHLVDAVLCVDELLADLSSQKPAWDEDVARDCIQRLGGTPSAENVERICRLRWVAQWLRDDGIGKVGLGSDN